ncbi:class I SAM-dependent methyltransferase [Simkania negevensis]|uniref:Phosphatidylethanolamine N-methyltransferase n=1 Tax=Simkania negevensis (strain ATCC VR-1471 / DSM 27360 / Z) TaxID=331113 RepID=F8L2V9_SIMNZ|nr:methyltransferase domain-containing protein [Simkania negevensis]CCB87805.1 phosphatidylethanolamine N-methyltransferase [Simkania negevensis Z]
MATSELHQRKHAGGYEGVASNYEETVQQDIAEDNHEQDPSCWSQVSQWIQNVSYQIFAYTVWDSVVSGFKPGRMRAIELMDVQSEDRILLVGEGSGLDFECLPEQTNKLALRAFDFSPEMVHQSKIKARQLEISEENCFIGDAQYLPFEHEKFDKIYFPLSVASIPNPSLALQEAERVLDPGGKIVIFDKLRDDDVPLSWQRTTLNVITKCVFADITRNLSSILASAPTLKIIHYESLAGKLDGVFAKYAGQYYRIAVVVRHEDYPDQMAVPAKLQ